MHLSAPADGSESAIEASERHRHLERLPNFSPFLFLIRKDKDVAVAAQLVESADSCTAQTHLNTNHVSSRCRTIVQEQWSSAELVKWDVFAGK